MTRRLVVAGAAVLLVAFLGVPVLTIVGRAFTSGAFVTMARSSMVQQALELSLLTTSISLVITTLLGTPLAFLLARRRGRWLSIVEIVVDLPLVLPPSVAGLGLLLVFGRRGLIGETFDALGVAIPFTTLAVILAQVFVAAPYYVRAARAAIGAVSRDLEDAARVDGASEVRVFVHVTMALARSGIGAGLVMSWARSLGEFGATILFAGNVIGRTQTLPLVVYAEFQAGDLDAAIAAAAVLVIAALVVLAAVRLGGGRRPSEASAV